MCLKLRSEGRKQCQRREQEAVPEMLWDGVLYTFPSELWQDSQWSRGSFNKWDLAVPPKGAGRGTWLCLLRELASGKAVGSREVQHQALQSS